MTELSTKAFYALARERATKEPSIRDPNEIGTQPLTNLGPSALALTNCWLSVEFGRGDRI